MKASKSSIEQFLSDRKVAVAGVSRNQKKFGYAVFKELRSKGYEVYPVNPATNTIDDEKCYSSVAELPDGISSLLVVTPKKETMEVVRQAHQKGIRHLWIQQMSETPEVIDFSKDKFEQVIVKQCILMFAEPAGMHKFHRGMKKLFGLLPK
jgi:predicted CoA-binding protein